MCLHVLKLHNNLDVQGIDSHKLLLKDIWSILGEEYNNPDHPDLQAFVRNDNFYKAPLIPEDTPINFDMLTPIELSQLMAYGPQSSVLNSESSPFLNMSSSDKDADVFPLVGHFPKMSFQSISFHDSFENLVSTIIETQHTHPINHSEHSEDQLLQKL
jgi:hypothetical protein